MQYYRLLLSFASSAVVFKVNSLTSAVGQAGAARTQHPMADSYLGAVAQAVFEGAIAIVIKKYGFLFK